MKGPELLRKLLEYLAGRHSRLGELGLSRYEAADNKTAIGGLTLQCIFLPGMSCSSGSAGTRGFGKTTPPATWLASLDFATPGDHVSLTRAKLPPHGIAQHSTAPDCTPPARQANAWSVLHLCVVGSLSVVCQLAGLHVELGGLRLLLPLPQHGMSPPRQEH